MDEFSDFPFEFSIVFPEVDECFTSPLSFSFAFEDVNLTLVERLVLLDLSPVLVDLPFETGVFGVSCLDFPVFDTSCLLDFATAAGVDVSSSLDLLVLLDSASSFFDLPAIFGPVLPSLLPISRVP